ncbi:MAG: gliding motility-associated C-terminal domain-containing protein [Bacteroidaceae bacterium]|nr:gliding motility-associated C-terminal domain-containing protein [Bacteroidaceae bacterium]
MKKLPIMIVVFGCLLLAWACSNDDDDNSGSTDATEQTGSQDSNDSLVVEETGASPVVSFYSLDEEDTVEVTPGESQTAQAPLLITLKANVGNPDGYNYVCEWRIWDTSNENGEYSPLVKRYDEETTYTLTKSGGYGIKLYVTFTMGTDTIEYESEQISVAISESKLTCPDGFSPNGDSINDQFRITAQSIVELDAKFFNRWGTKLHSVTLETIERVEGEPDKLILWDGKVKGKYVSDGLYLLYLKALGSDGIKYDIKKSISVLTGFHENEESEGGGGSTE